MPETLQIQFEGGMDRRNDAPPSSPYELHNARLEPYGSVRAHKQPETMVDPVDAGPNKKAEPGGAPPWKRWNGQWLSRFDGGREIMQARDEYNGSLFVTGTNSQEYSINGQQTLSPHYQTLPHNATAFSELVDPPAIRSIDFTEVFWQGEGTQGNNIQDKSSEWNILSSSTSAQAPVDGSISARVAGLRETSGVGYLLIPVNERQEAGPWAYFSVAVQTDDLPPQEDRLNDYVQPGIKAVTNSQTSQVEVYRTREWKNITAIDEGQWNVSTTKPPDMTYYKIGTVSAESQTADGGFGGAGEKTLKFGDYWAIPNQNAEDAANQSDDFKASDYTVPDKTLDRDINAWAYESVSLSQSTASQYSFKHTFGPGKYFGADSLFMNGRERMVAGSVQWPTKPPQFAMAVKQVGVLPNDITFTNEYQPTDSKTVHSATVSTQDILQAWPVWQGEQAIHVYDENSDQYKRMTVSGDGLYGKVTYEEQETATTNFPLSSANQQEFVYERDVALLSEQFRPMEMSLEQQFVVPDGEKIRAVEPARLSEEESIATYSFYVLTDSGVYVVNRQNETEQLRSVSRVGVQNYRVDFSGGPRPEYEYALVCPTKYGTAYIGTDDRVYVLNGRKFQTIDDAVPNLWWSDYGEPALADEEFQAIYNEYSDVWFEQTDGGSVEFESLTAYDMAFDENQNELYVVTYNNVWTFDFERKAWVGNYNIEGATSASRLEYHNEVMLHSYVPDGAGGVEDKYQLLNENGPDIEDTSLVTNPILRRPGETKIRQLSADYDPLFKENDASWPSDGSTTVSLQDGSKDLFSDPDNYSTVYITGGADGGKDYTSLIETIVDSSTAELVDPLGPAPTSSPPIRWYLPARIRQEATGDYYTAFESGGNPIRRTEKSYLLRPRRRKAPRVNGSGHVIRMETFRSFKSIQLTVERFVNK